MTCIIGGNCTDDVVMIAGRKIRYGDGNVSCGKKYSKIIILLLWHRQVTALFNLKLVKQFRD